MKVKVGDGTKVRIVLYGMATQADVLARIASQWGGAGLLGSPWANLVGGWCVKHFRDYGEAPNDKIYNYYHEWEEGIEEEEEPVAEAVARFIAGVRKQRIESEDSSYFLDTAEKLFNEVLVRDTTEELRLDSDDNQVDDWFQRIHGIRPFNLKERTYSNPTQALEPWNRAYDAETRTPGLVTYAGALGRLTRNSFERGAFYAYMAPDKTGKTTWLTDAAYRAARRKRRVAFFDTGDSIEEEVYERLGRRITKQPREQCQSKYPVGWLNDGQPKLEIRNFEGVNAIDSFRQARRDLRSDGFRIACYSSGTLSVADIDSILFDWEKEGWKADVVIVDYADILAPPKGIRDTLDQIDETWKSLRRLSQDKNCLVLTATQASASIYGKEDKLLSRKHFSGRKTKLAHVNGMLGINVTPDEKRVGMSRVNWIVRRKGKSYDNECVYAVGHPPTYNPVILSRW